MDRRRFGIAVSSLAVGNAVVGADHGSVMPMRAVAIGHTGRGNFGHGLESVWGRIDESSLVAIADADDAGRAKAAGKLKLKPEHVFANYHEMLEAARPDIVAVCPRHPDQHHDMILAAVRADAKGIYVEKPFVRTPAEADAVIEACAKKNVKLAVAHRNRYHPTLKTVSKLVADGAIGKLLEIRGRGKGDRRGGAEDLWVLGSHVLNMMSFIGGQPQRCSAVMMKDGRQVQKSDVYDGAEGLGLLAGNELHARYEFDSGVVGYFDSVANDGTKNAGFGLQLIGSAGVIAMMCDKDPLAYFVPGNPFQPTQQSRPWLPISSAGIDKPETQKDIIAQVHDHRLPARDLVAAITEGRAPLCDVHEGALTIEMICAAFDSHRRGGQSVSLPLVLRDNPLGEL